MHELFASAFVLVQVVFIDLVLASDNAVVVGMAAAGLPRDKRRKAIVIGIAAATVLRIALAGFATMLLALVGLLLAGGILLMWVCWKMFREIRQQAGEMAEAELACGPSGSVRTGPPVKTLRQSVIQIVLADVSMSVDNVLAVAGAAREHPAVMAAGLLLSVVLMGIAASFIANLLTRYRWVAYCGLLIILFVAGSMIYRGSLETLTAVGWLHGSAGLS
jgi:YjbE family integral membrane protein